MTGAIISETTDASNVGRLSPHHRYEGASGMASTSVPPRSFNREELAWAAGFFDGEGCTRGPSGSSRLRLTISQAGDTELLERFRRAVGVGAIYGPYQYRHQRLSKKPFCALTIASFETAQHAICCLWPWLGSIKRAQALTALRQWHAHPRRWCKATPGYPRSVCRRGHRVEGDNAYISKTGYQVCRECRRQWERNKSAKAQVAVP